MTNTTMMRTVNGLDLNKLGTMVDAIQADAGNGHAQFRVRTAWTGGTRTETYVDQSVLGGVAIPRGFKIVADEPMQLLGTDTAPNPQELLMAAVNACMTVGYVANASLRGITVSRLEIEMQGELDLRGFLGLDPQIPAGYREIAYRVRIEGDGSPDQYAEIHAAVQATSPNFFNLSQPIRMVGTLEIG